MSRIVLSVCANSFHWYKRPSPFPTLLFDNL